MSYKFNGILIKIAITFFTELDKECEERVEGVIDDPGQKGYTLLNAVLLLEASYMSWQL